MGTRRDLKRADIDISVLQAAPGSYAYSALDALTLPTGGTEQFPLIIAQGVAEGPVLWLTASIHGDEYTGIQVIHRLLTPDLPSRMRGTLVAVPTLNPAGLRTGDRTPYYMRRHDPNRLFPSPVRRSYSDPPLEPPPPLEVAFRRLFDYIDLTADALIDLHNYTIGSIPLAFRDPIYFTDNTDLPAARRLWSATDALLNAFGFTVVNEFVSAEYLKKALHRSVSGAALHVAGIPAFTAELGGYLTIDPAIVKAAISGLRNVMRHLGMLADAPESLEGIPVLSPAYPVRRMQHPHAPQSGIIEFLVQGGNQVKAGQPVARLVDIYGRPIGERDGLIRSEYDGFVLGVMQGAAFYQGDPLMNLAVRDTGDTLIRYLP